MSKFKFELNEITKSDLIRRYLSFSQYSDDTSQLELDLTCAVHGTKSKVLSNLPAYIAEEVLDSDDPLAALREHAQYFGQLAARLSTAVAEAETRISVALDLLAIGNRRAALKSKSGTKH